MTPTTEANPEANPWMQCGHRAHTRGKGNQWTCLKCPNDPKATQPMQEFPNLTGREMTCKRCGKQDKSRWNANYFEWEPTKPRDKYHCGCGSKS